MRAALLIAALALIACDGRAASNAVHEQFTNAQRLVQAAGARGEVPPGDYVCNLAVSGPEPATPTRYGALNVRGSAYRLQFEHGPALHGQLHATPAGQLIWNGLLGPIDAPPRGITRAVVRAAGEDAVELVLDFAPALPAPTAADQVVCTMRVGATV